MKKILFPLTAFLLVIQQYGQAQNYALPFKQEDFNPFERVFTGDHKAGIQGEGEDLGIMRYTGNNKWSFVKEGTNGTKNSDLLIYGKPVYAMADGKVIGCWCNAPENPRPKLSTDTDEGQEWLHPKFKSKEMPGGGNMLWIEHPDGTRALYAHMIPGTIAANLCPNKDALFPKPLASGEHENMYLMLPAAKQVTVKKGQFLGKAGNSGSSTGPHTHVHMEKNGMAAVMKFETGLYKNYSDAGTDINSGWSSFATKEIPDGKVLIRPPRSTTYRMIDFEFYTNGGKNMYVGIFKPATYSPAAVFENNWAAFLNKWQAIEAKGNRMIDFEYFTGGSGPMYAGIFEPGSYSPAALFKNNWADFLKGWQAIEAKGNRMIDFEFYNAGGNPMYAGIFKPGTYAPAALFKNNWADFLKGWQDLEAKGNRMIDMEHYSAGGNAMYAGIFKPASYTPAALIKNDWSDFLKGWQDIEAKGNRMIDFDFYISGGKPTYSGIFSAGTYPPAAVFSSTWEEFLERWRNLE